METADSSHDDPYVLAEEAADALRLAFGVVHHDVVVTLGSGWAGAADGLGQVIGDVELSTIPGFAAPRVPGHRDLARSVIVGHHNVLVLGGRVHLYEGFSAAEVVHGVRTAAALGCRTAILTNAAGGIDADYVVGRPVLIADQLNLTGTSPMAGAAPPAHLPGRFCDMTDAFSPRLRSIAREVDSTLREGVYAGMFGGAYETPAEVKMIAGLGADLVGMSTVLETIAARHLEMEVLGISLVTNPAAGVGDTALSHEDVVKTAAGANETIVELIRGVLTRLDTDIATPA